MGWSILINSVVIAVVVAIHYESLRILSQLLPRLGFLHRTRMVVGVAGALIAHTIEVWIFGLAYYLMIGIEGFGTLERNFDGSFFDCVYFSFTTYTSLRFGDIEPTGLLRFLTGLESLTGLLMIGWTASFFFVEMREYWNKE